MNHHFYCKILLLKEVLLATLCIQMCSKFLENTPLQVNYIQDQLINIYSLVLLVKATDISGIATLSETKTFRIEEDVKPELVFCDPVAR